MAFVHEPVDTSDPALAAAYRAVGDRAAPENWTLFSFPRGGPEGRLEVLASGRGGLPELRAAIEEAGDRVVFGAFQVVATDMVARHRLVYVHHVGPRVDAQHRAAALVQTQDVCRFFRGVSLELDVKNLDDQLDERAVGVQLLRASAAHGPKTLDFGGGVVLQAAELLAGENDSDSGSELSE